MKKFSIEDLYESAGGDGACVMLGSPISVPDYEALYQAWSIERGQNIESEFLLDLSRATIAHLLESKLLQLNEDSVETRDLIERIESYLRKARTRRS